MLGQMGEDEVTSAHKTGTSILLSLWLVASPVWLGVNGPPSQFVLRGKLGSAASRLL